VLPAGAVAEVGGKSTTAADVSVDAATADEVGRWSHGSTPFGISVEHF
jgi:hypothetical protein